MSLHQYLIILKYSTNKQWKYTKYQYTKWYIHKSVLHGSFNTWNGVFFTIYNNVYEHAQFDFPYEHPIPHNHSLKFVTLIK